MIYRREPRRIVYLLLHYPGGHWDFVKGKVEGGESLLDTVRREAQEETGIGALEFAAGFERRIAYEFTHAGSVISKTVVFYLAETSESDVRLSDEHVGYRWSEYGEALETLTHGNARGVLEAARLHLESGVS